MAVSTHADDSERIAEAMVAYQAGDVTAFDRLHAALGPILRRYLQSLARDATRVDDLLQETFLQVHRARRTYDPSRPVVPWALAIARHVFLMECRTRKRKGDLDALELDDTVAAAGRGHDEAVIARDRLRRGLSGLTPGTRRAVLLHHVQGWSFREIAQRLGINSAAAKLRASRGVSTLRSRLHDTDGRDEHH
jgi:RNA polymerase sigma-70 factor (ECF subfamily)